MCLGCWREAGSPKLDAPKIRLAVDAIKILYDTHPTGGNLHVVVDDWNVEDGHVRWETYQEPDDKVEEVARQALQVLTPQERVSALYWLDTEWYYVEGPGKP